MTSPLILASASPRRRELLQNLNLTFDIIPADIDETPREGEAPKDLVNRLSTRKAATIAAEYSDALIIAADTVVTLNGDVFGKPVDNEENRKFIEYLSGRTHQIGRAHV